MDFLSNRVIQSKISFHNEMLNFNENFRLYMITVHRVHRFSPEIIANVTLLDFTITDMGLQQHMLSTIIAEQRSDLKELKEKLIIETTKNQEMLYKLETNILEVLSQSEGNILEDENAINILSNSKIMSEEILIKQKSNVSLEQKINFDYVQYITLADYAKILYFCLNRMAYVKSIYQFTLNWFMKIFIENIQANRRGRRDSQITIDSMKNHFTMYLCRTVFPSLFFEDRAVFTFLITIEILRFEVGKNEPKTKSLTN